MASKYIKRNDNRLFLKCFSKENLVAAWQQLSSTFSGNGFLCLNKKLDNKWFSIVSTKLLTHSFIYPKFTNFVQCKKRGLLFPWLGVKIIERSLVSVIESLCEGV